MNNVYIYGNSLMHMKKGEEAKEHKYISRENKNGKWIYNYGEESKNSSVNKKTTESNNESDNKQENNEFDTNYKKAEQIQSEANTIRNEAYLAATEEYNNGKLERGKDASYNSVKFELMTAVTTAWYEIGIDSKDLNSWRPQNLNSPEGVRWLKEYRKYQNKLKEVEEFTQFADNLLQTINNLQKKNGSVALAEFNRDTGEFEYNDKFDIPTDEFEFKYLENLKKYKPLNSDYEFLPM